MKKIISLILLFTLASHLIACEEKKIVPLSCNEIVYAYIDAGYQIKQHLHNNMNTEPDLMCHMQICDPDNPEMKYIYFDIYTDGEKAKAAAEKQKHNIFIWFIFAINGESRWLKSENYGRIHYHTFDDDMIKPLEKLIKQFST